MDFATPSTSLIIEIKISLIVIGLKKLVFSTNSLCQVVVIGQCNKQITVKVVVLIFGAMLNNLRLLCPSFNANFLFFRNLAIVLFLETVVFMIHWKWTSRRLLQSVIIHVLVINKSVSHFAVIRFFYHSYYMYYRPNWTLFSPISITHYRF